MSQHNFRVTDEAIMTSESQKLTNQQKEFLRNHTIEGLEMIPAARKAGYEAKDVVLRRYMRALLKKKKARDYVLELMEEVKFDNKIEQTHVMAFLKSVMYNDTVAARDRLKSAELIGKALNMFVDTHVVSDADTHAKLSNEAWEYRLKKMSDKVEKDSQPSNVVPIGEAVANG